MPMLLFFFNYSTKLSYRLIFAIMFGGQSGNIYYLLKNNK